MKKTRHNQNGFTLVEALLAMVVMSFSFVFISDFLLSNAKTMMAISDHETSLADARFALNQISYELLRVDPSTEIHSFSETEIEFTDSEGNISQYSLDTLPDGMGLFRDGYLLIGPIDSFEITYFDNQGNELNPDTASASSIARMKVKMITTNNRGQGVVPLQTSVTPRSVIGYENYQ